MHVINTTTGQDEYFDLSEKDLQFFRTLTDLSEDGADLRFVFEDADEKELFERRFPGEQLDAFVHELRGRVLADDTLTYREDTGAGEYFSFVTYFRPD